MSSFIVRGYYEPKMDEKRAARIRSAMKRYRIAHVLHPGDFEWTVNLDDAETEIKIFVDDLSRANRLASELRACGMIVGMAPAEEFAAYHGVKLFNDI